MFTSRIRSIIVLLIILALAALPYVVVFAGMAPGGSD